MLGKIGRPVFGYLGRQFSTPKPSLIQTCMNRVRREARKLVNGCKLLYRDSQFLMKKKYQVTFGDEQYTLKEKKAMSTTSADLLKMVPFSVFIIIPGAEVLLPPLVLVFPNMIPSTFVSKSKQQERLQSIIRRRPKYADLLHRFLLTQVKDSDLPFIQKLKLRPQSISRQELIDNAELFATQAAFRHMTVKELRAVCRFFCMRPWIGVRTLNKLIISPVARLLNRVKVNVKPYWEPKGFPFATLQRNLLMFQLRGLMKQLRDEDMLLLAENFEEIDSDLLFLCCAERGIPTDYTTEKEMKQQLREWVTHSTYPTKTGRLRNEVLLFAQVMLFIEDVLDLSQEEDEPDFDEPGLADHTIDRVLHFDKSEIEALLKKLGEVEVSQLSEDERQEYLDTLKQVLDENLMFEHETRIEQEIKRLEATSSSEQQHKP